MFRNEVKDNPIHYGKKKVEFATDLYKLCYQKHSPVLVS